MSGGGGNTTTVQNADPWAGAQPYLLDIMSRGQTYANSPAAYFPGPTYLGPTEGQLQGWNNQLGYSDQVFGGAAAPRFGEATGALSGALTGTSGLGSMASRIGSLDTTPAFTRALSGTPDYGGVQASIDAANAPILRQFNEEILPGLNQRASFLGNPTGGIKTLNRVLPELGARMSTNAAAITEQERLRALNEQTNTAMGLGQLGGQLAGAQNDASLRAAALFPNLMATGALPGTLSSQFADWGAGFQQQALQDQMDRYNYYQRLPLTSTQDYLGLVGGMGGLGGTTTATGPGGSRLGSAIGGGTLGYMAGGALGGLTAGSAFGPIGALLGAGLGYFLG